MKNYQFIDLTHQVHSNIPTWDLGCGYHLNNICDYHQCAGEYKFRAQVIDIRASAGTHIDSPAHCFEGGRDISALALKELICPCVVIDVLGKADEHYKISVSDIESFEKKYGTIRPGTFVLLVTGWSRLWDMPEKYHNNLLFPSVSAQAVELLLTRGITGIGIDTLSPDSGGETFPVHALLLGADKFIVENVAQAKEMPPVGAYIFIMPLKLQGATESPIRLMGMIPR